ncbi:39S ribosomal protein L18, mitochondrial isoform X2 [Myotis lucifugus]|uniref:39S ribosomal protein L18, mitochondrial isoform X2 n=1 Tax=Myotis lucifugus TaxID=59463 RepID=UPI000CCC9DD5|nr:39S ribosomal protein L18, mitochondrial isoform X2 [Myotis lucifugus]
MRVFPGSWSSNEASRLRDAPRGRNRNTRGSEVPKGRQAWPARVGTGDPPPVTPVQRGSPNRPRSPTGRGRCRPAQKARTRGGRGVASLSTRPEPEVQPEADPLGNEAVAPEFTNRNPRNLELLAVARKERGWGTVWPSREFWHRLRVIRTQHHIEALVEHRNGQVVVSASTREWAIKKHLYSTKNVAACENIGRVLAERCLEAGINFMVYQPTPWEAASESMQRLQRAVTEGGVVLREPRRIYE